MPANQLRMWFSAMAYVLVDSLRRVGLRHTQFADAAVATIRLKLLKLGAQVRRSVRRLHFALASGCPNKIEFEMAICICGGPSTPPEPHALAKTKCRSAAPSDGARPPGLALREAARRRTRNPRTSNHSAPTRSSLPSFPEKTAVVGFIRPYKLMEFGNPG